MNYLYGSSLLLSLGISLTSAKILAGKFRTSPRARLYLSLLLGLDTEEEYSYGTIIMVLWVALCVLSIALAVIEPALQLCLTAYMSELVLSRLLRVRRQLKSIDKLMKYAKQKCEVHPDITKAICMEEDGEIILVCPICDPETAEDFGIEVKDCIENTEDNNDLG